MSITICKQKAFREVTGKVLGQLFGIFMRKARQNSCLPLEAIALLAGMGASEWLAIESGQVPDPAQLDSMAAALGMSPEQMGAAVRICKDAWD
ncbi:MAG TPA: helix-turn-helix transcriptional regulator [Terracidiphilus sp.]|jgi:transcriptional regulator with XRE-family HTH domain